MLKANYEKSVDAYIKEFEKKHEIDFDGWVGDLIGEVACFGDYTFYFSDIKYVIDHSISFEWMTDWYWFVVEYQKCYFNLKTYNKLRSDEYSKDNFSLDSFEKKLIYMRISD